jgi:ribonucleoside-diphosphate reductase alpha chain
MSTSVLDYIFRERAISYLGRSDLAHVEPNDLRSDELGRGVREEQRSHPAIGKPAPRGGNGLQDLVRSGVESGVVSAGFVRSLLVLNGGGSGDAASGLSTHQERSFSPAGTYPRDDEPEDEDDDEHESHDDHDHGLANGRANGKHTHLAAMALGAEGYSKGSAAVTLAMTAERKGTLVAATLTRVQRAKLSGYVGESCSECGNFTLVRNGTCLKCDTCGATSGCS